jgi:hypothetical protein
MLILRLYLLLLIGPFLIPALRTPAAQATPNLPHSKSLAQPSGTGIAPIIFIGHPPKHHYVILIPLPQDDLIRSHLTRIRDKIAPTGQIPFIAQHHLGRYIYAGSFTERNQAENTRQRLLSDEPRARVVYFP